MASATERLEINSFLAKHGLGQLNEPGLVPQLAYLIRDHVHLRRLLHRCDPLLKRTMYEALRPYLRFTPHPLDVYEAEMGMEADERKLPAYDAKTGNLVPYADYDPANKDGSLTRLAEKAIHDAYAEEKAGGHVLTVTCHKCTSQADFKGATQVSATIEARRAGWVYQEIDGKGVEICPKCPSARPGTKTGSA